MTKRNNAAAGADEQLPPADPSAEQAEPTHITATCRNPQSGELVTAPITPEQQEGQ